MVEFGGKAIRLYYAYEDVPGTPETTGFRSVGDLQGEPQVTADNTLTAVHGSQHLNTRAILEGHHDFKASMDWNVKDGALVIGCLGHLDKTSPTTQGSNYKHFGGTHHADDTDTAPSASGVANFTLSYGLAGDTGDVLVLTGAKCNSITLTGNNTEPLKASAEFAFLDFTTDQTVRSATEADAGPWQYFMSVGNMTLSGVNKGDITEWSVTVPQNLNVVKGSGSRKPTTILQGNREVTGNITFNYDATTELQMWMASGAAVTTPSASGVVRSFDASILYDTEEATTLASYRALKVEIKDMKLGSMQRSIPVDGNVVSETYAYTAKKCIVSYNNATADSPF